MAAEQPRQWNQLLLSSFILVLLLYFLTHLGQPPPSLPWGRLLAHRRVLAWLQGRGPIASSPGEADRRQCSAAGWRLPAQPGWEMKRSPGLGAGHPHSSTQGLRKGRTDFWGRPGKRQLKNATEQQPGPSGQAASRDAGGMWDAAVGPAPPEGRSRAFPLLSGWEKPD